VVLRRLSVGAASNACKVARYTHVMLALAVAWYGVLSVAGVVGLGLLRRWGVGSGAAVAVARVSALVMAGFVGWVAGLLGVSHWWWAGAVALAVALAIGIRGLREVAPVALCEAELVGFAVFLLLALLRLPVLPITATEKPMDLAIWATLLRPGTFPPVDPWLAGHSLAYYYWGFVPWVLPTRVLGVPPDVAYNLLVPTLAAISAQGGWALARGLGGGRRASLLAAALVVFSGTPDGWRQLLAGRPLGSLDLWSSSRAIEGTITEFPLFTFHLGDLHPHLLVVPLVLASLFYACALGRGAKAQVPLAALAALLFGAAAAANPWCALPVGGAIALVVLVRDVPDRVTSLTPWVLVASVGLLGWAAFLPFWHGYAPPVTGIGLVTTPTRWDELALYLGGALLPVLVVGWEVSRRLGGWEPARRQLSRAAWVSAVAVVATLSGRVALAIGMTTLVLLAMWVSRGKPRQHRQAWALTLVPLGLVAMVEVVFLRDPYGGEFYRMNTVFKMLHLSFTLLAVTGPLLLEWLWTRRQTIARFTVLAVCCVSLPHFLSLLAAVPAARPHGWGGLSWMAPGEASVAAELRGLPQGSVLVEGLGDAYSDAGRMTSASGVPCVLGWENHERVWRGGSIESELARRRSLVTRLYNAGDPATVREIAAELAASHLVVGSLERRSYPAAGLAAVMAAGKVEAADDGCTVVRVGE